MPTNQRKTDTNKIEKKKFMDTVDCKIESKMHTRAYESIPRSCNASIHTSAFHKIIAFPQMANFLEHTR